MKHVEYSMSSEIRVNMKMLVVALVMAMLRGTDIHAPQMINPTNVSDSQKFCAVNITPA